MLSMAKVINGNSCPVPFIDSDTDCARFIPPTTTWVVSASMGYFFRYAPTAVLLNVSAKSPNTFDIGFILSFVSTMSIMLFQSKIDKKVQFLPKVIKEGFTTSLSAQIGVTPILFVTFGQFNIWSPLINALILWTVPILMVLGALGGVVGLAVPFLGKSILWLSYPLLWWFVGVVEVFS